MAVRFMVAFLIRSGDSYYFTLSDIPGDRVVSFGLLNTVRRRRLRVAIVQALSHWQKDSNLSCFHDKAAQDKLPAEEQKAFTPLCADVVAMLKKLDQAVHAVRPHVWYRGLATV
jgi:hypothetical protein